MDCGPSGDMMGQALERGSVTKRGRWRGIVGHRSLVRGVTSWARRGNVGWHGVGCAHRIKKKCYWAA
jgi:hypothetical protein